MPTSDPGASNSVRSPFEGRRAVGYIRVSTLAQVEVGQSPEAQLHSIEAFAGIRNLGLIDVYRDDGLSGDNLQRPQLDAVRQRIRAGEVDVLIVRNIDRLTRNGSDLKELLDELDRHNVRLVTTDDLFGDQRGLDSEDDRVALEVATTFAGWQRERIGYATRTAQENLRAQGQAFNRDIYGFDKEADGRLAPNRQELDTLALIRDLNNRGKSASEIARRLNREGRLGKRGGQWQAKTVLNKLRHLTDYAALYAPVVPPPTTER